MNECPECGKECIKYELRRWGKCIDCKAGEKK